MEMRTVLGFAVIAIAGCKGKDEKAAAKPATPAIDAAPPAIDAAAITPAVKDPPPGPPPPDMPLGATAATLPAGKRIDVGCFAWSSKRKAVACITGWYNLSEDDLSLAFLGSDEPPIDLDTVVGGDEPTTLADDSAVTANEALAKGGYGPFSGKGTELAERTPVTLAGVAVTWTRKLTAKGGQNEAPTHKNTVTARCKGAPLDVLEDEHEGDLPTVSIRPAGDGVLVEARIGVAREGELGAHFVAALIDPATCRADPDRG